MCFDRVLQIVERAPSDNGRDRDGDCATGKLGYQPFKPQDEEIRVNRKGLTPPHVAEGTEGGDPALVGDARRP
jgi:hypothetical protein